MFGYLVSSILFKPAVTLTCGIDNASTSSLFWAVGGGGGTPYNDYTGMLGPKGVGFSAFRADHPRINFSKFLSPNVLSSDLDD